MLGEMLTVQSSVVVGGSIPWVERGADLCAWRRFIRPQETRLVVKPWHLLHWTRAAACGMMDLSLPSSVVHLRCRVARAAA